MTSSLKLEGFRIVCRMSGEVDGVWHPPATGCQRRPQEWGVTRWKPSTPASQGTQVPVQSLTLRRVWCCCCLIGRRLVAVGPGWNVVGAQPHDAHQPAVDAQIVDDLDIVQVEVLFVFRNRTRAWLWQSWIVGLGIFQLRYDQIRKVCFRDFVIFGRIGFFDTAFSQWKGLWFMMFVIKIKRS